MRTPKNHYIKLLCIILLIIAVGCKKSSSGGDDTSSDDSSSDSTSDTPAVSSGCGVILNANRTARLENPAPSGSGERVSVQAIKSDLVIVTRLEGINEGTEQLVQLHGVTADGVPSFLESQGVELIERLTSGTALLFPAGAECSVTVLGGGLGILGQLFTRAGDNINERLIELGAVVPSDNGCEASALLGCYNEIDVIEQFSTERITQFLWKPVSESNGNVVVLVNPTDIRVVVSGSINETFVDFGPSNGRGTTARGNRPGCAYGSNVRVEFFDFQGLRVRVNNGNESVTVPNGCNRLDTRF